MVNFITQIPTLKDDFIFMVESIGFKPNLQIHKPNSRQHKFTVRISKNAKDFLKKVEAKKD